MRLVIVAVVLLVSGLPTAAADPASGFSATVTGSLEFGSFRIGTSEATAPPSPPMSFSDRVTVTNTGSVAFQVDGSFASSDDRDALEYAGIGADPGTGPTILGSCLPGLGQPPPTIEPGQSCVVAYAFRPAHLGPRPGTGTVLVVPVCGSPPCSELMPSFNVDGTGSDGYELAHRSGRVDALGDLAGTGLRLAGGSDPSPVVASLVSHRGAAQAVSIHADGTIAGGGFDRGPLRLRAPIVGAALSPDSTGLWLAAADGGVFTFGSAPFVGSMAGLRLASPIVGIALSDQVDDGYWLVAADGGIFSFGDAPFFGSTGGVHLAQPIVGMAAHMNNNIGPFSGYWLVAADGGIFSFGDAPFFGSTGAIALAAPIVGMITPYDTSGYWLAARDGGVFSFGVAPFYGSTAGTATGDPVVAIGAAHPMRPFV